MTIVASKIERCRLIHETTFGADMSGTMGSFLTLPFREGTMKLTLQETLESPMHVQQRVDGHPTRVHLPRQATCEFEANLETFTTKATNAVAATQSWLGVLFETWMGAKHLMTGTTVDGAGSETAFTVNAGTTLRPGAAVGLATGVGGILEVREIKSKGDTLNVALKHNLDSAAANADVVYGSATYYCNPLTTGAEFKSLQFIAEGYVQNDKWALQGGAVTGCEFTLENGQVTKAKFTVTFAAWYVADGNSHVSADLVSDTLSRATYINTNTLVQADSQLCKAVVGTADSVEVMHASSQKWTPAVAYAQVRTPSGVNTIAQFVRIHVSPVLEVEMTIPYEDNTWFDIRDDDDIVAMWLQIGSVPSVGAIVFSAPNCQVIDVQRADVDGIMSQVIKLAARHDTETTALVGYEGLAESAFRIHML